MAIRKDLVERLKRRRDAIHREFKEELAWITPESNPTQTLNRALYQMLLMSAVPVETSKGIGFGVLQPVKSALAVYYSFGFANIVEDKRELDSQGKIIWKPKGHAPLTYPAAMVEEDRLRGAMSELSPGDMELEGFPQTAPHSYIALKRFGGFLWPHMDEEMRFRDLLIAAGSEEDIRPGVFACAMNLIALGAIKVIEADDQGRPLVVKPTRGGRNFCRDLQL